MAVSFNNLAVTHRFVVKINAKDYLAVKLKEIYPQLGLPNMLVFLCLDWKRESLLPVCPCSRKIGHYSKYYKSGQSWLLEKLCQKVLRGELACLFLDVHIFNDKARWSCRSFKFVYKKIDTLGRIRNFGLFKIWGMN